MVSDEKYIRTFVRVIQQRFRELEGTISDKESIEQQFKAAVDSGNAKEIEIQTARLLYVIGANTYNREVRRNSKTLKHQLWKLSRSYAQFEEKLGAAMPKNIDKYNAKLGEKDLLLVNKALAFISQNRGGVEETLHADQMAFNGLIENLTKQYDLLGDTRITATKRCQDYFKLAEKQSGLLNSMSAQKAFIDEFLTKTKEFEAMLKEFKIKKKFMGFTYFADNKEFAKAVGNPIKLEALLLFLVGVCDTSYKMFHITFFFFIACMIWVVILLIGYRLYSLLDKYEMQAKGERAKYLFKDMLSGMDITD